MIYTAKYKYLLLPVLMLELTFFFAGKAEASADLPAEIDKSAYVSADEYENPPIELHTVKVGLDYGSSAVEDAQFVNCSGGGFSIGYHSADRSFSSFAQTDSPDISVKFNPASNPAWHIQLKKEYATKTRAMFTALKNGGYLEKAGSAWRVYLGGFETREECAKAISGQKLSGTPYCSVAYRITILDNRDGKELFGFEYGKNSVSIQPLAGDAELTDYSGNRYHGSYNIQAGNNGLTVINLVDLETYVKGVIPYEMSSSWPLEALKAQAVCARTYAVYNENGYQHYGFDLTDDTYSQVYRGVQEANEHTDRAVDETAGLTVRYEGQVCRIYYSASDGGATEAGKNVFGVDLPYLMGVYDPYEDYVNYDIKDWQFKKSGKEIADILNEGDFHIGEVTRIEPTLSDTGNVIALSFYDDAGRDVTIEGRRCYNILGLYSCRFNIGYEDGLFVFSGDGWGHNCGMSQYGAKAMASVFNYDYEDIIRFYFTGAYVA